MTYCSQLSHVRVGLISVVLLIIGNLSAYAADEIKVEDLLQHHLDSIGTSDVRAAAKSRVVQGAAAYKILVGGTGSITGKAVIVSEGPRLHVLLKVNADRYRGEKFVRNGDKTFVAGTYADATRSEFGEFLRANDVPLREGLLCGVLSTGWPLLDLSSHGAKLKYEGKKKVDGLELLAVSYRPKKGTDLRITLYFAPDSFRHVMTLYTTEAAAGIGPTETESARQNQARYRIEERFSDFKTVDGLTLPWHYDLRYQQELQNGFTKLVEWDVTAATIDNNISLDPRNFETH